MAELTPEMRCKIACADECDDCGWECPKCHESAGIEWSSMIGGYLRLVAQFAILGQRRPLGGVEAVVVQRWVARASELAGAKTGNMCQGYIPSPLCEISRSLTKMEVSGWSYDRFTRLLT